MLDTWSGIQFIMMTAFGLQTLMGGTLCNHRKSNTRANKPGTHGRRQIKLPMAESRTPQVKHSLGRSTKTKFLSLFVAAPGLGVV